MLAWTYILFMVIALPILAIRSASAIRSGRVPLPARGAVHANTLITLTVLLGIAAVVALREDLQLFPVWRPGWIDIAAIAGFMVASLTMLAGRSRTLDGPERIRLEAITMSNWRDPRQLLPYTLICIMAGLAEEVAFRGVLSRLLERELGSSFAATAIASLAFGLAHAMQGFAGAVLASLFALAFHMIVIATGDLYSAIIAHAAYDLIAGVVVARMAMSRNPTG